MKWKVQLVVVKKKRGKKTKMTLRLPIMVAMMNSEELGVCLCLLEVQTPIKNCKKSPSAGSRPAVSARPIGGQQVERHIQINARNPRNVGVVRTIQNESQNPRGKYKKAKETE
jgi:hypothetical protein